ncbi:MAG: spore cortex biosynthesis protein YabQ [Ruminococcus sp.]|nr:spore cortex biosynthesis protein YabQ [Ruminococcus sp.]
MEFTLSELLISFLYSILLGFILGFLYEPVRVFHKLGFNKKLHYYICDILFMIFSGIVTFYFSLSMLEGTVRAFVILGEVTGFVTFYHTVRRLLDIIFNPIIAIFKKILKKLLKTARKVMYNIRIKSEYCMTHLRNKIVKVRLDERQKSGMGERKHLRKGKR